MVTSAAHYAEYNTIQSCNKILSTFSTLHASHTVLNGTSDLSIHHKPQSISIKVKYYISTL